MNRSGIAVDQMILYVISIVVVGLILIFGYKAIKNINENVEKVGVLQFKKDLSSAVSQLRNDYGSVIVFDSAHVLAVPNRFRYVCFVDEHYAGTVEAGGKVLPLLTDNIIDTDENVFLVIEDMEYPMYVEGLTVDQYFCIKVTQSRVDLRLEGAGDKVLATTLS